MMMITCMLTMMMITHMLTMMMITCVRDDHDYPHACDDDYAYVCMQ